MDSCGLPNCSQKNTFGEKFNTLFPKWNADLVRKDNINAVDKRDLIFFGNNRSERTADQQVAAVITIVVNQALLAEVI